MSKEGPTNKDQEIDDEEWMLRLRELFQEEAGELLDELEQGLLLLETRPDDEEVIGRVFRAMHTIKGSGAACGFTDVSAFAHDVETLLDHVRKGRMAASQEVIDLILAARDQIAAMFNVHYRGGEADLSRLDEILDAVRRLSKTAKPLSPVMSKQEGSSGRTSPDAASCRLCAYRIRFRPKGGLAAKNGGPIAVLKELRGLGAIHVVAHHEHIPFIEEFTAGACYTSWDVILTTDRGRAAIDDAFLLVKDESDLVIEMINEEGSHVYDDGTYKKLGEILMERGDLSREELQAALQSLKRIGEVLVDSGRVSEASVQSALAEQQQVREMREERVNTSTLESIRVATEKLDALVDLVGELVTVQARLTALARRQADPELRSVAEQVERITADLHDRSMSMRMVPIGTLFGNFRRISRDLARDLGKEVDLVAEGAETELDKTVIEKLNDPLLHLIRNCIDHGLEPPAGRATAGKPRAGVVSLSAEHSGAHVLIRVSDDGIGLDRETILANAVQRGLIPQDAQLADKELYALIFSAGFSTARSISSVSGRGVGLDVVKRAIDGLRGTVEVESRAGQGTTVTLKLPLTLAVIDGFLTAVGGAHYVIPMALVEECVELDNRTRSQERQFVRVREHAIPYIRLREQFGMSAAGPLFEQVVITRVGAERVGFVVDQVIGSHQTVIKSLGPAYRNAEGVSGATILGDGTVALILDIPALAALVEREEVRS